MLLFSVHSKNNMRHSDEHMSRRNMCMQGRIELPETEAFRIVDELCTLADKLLLRYTT